MSSVHVVPRRPANLFERFAMWATESTGRSSAFVLALGAVVVWAATGPIFGFSDTWQLVINTSTTIVTFLMVFLIQRAQNKDSKAIHLKLAELVAAVEGASNRLIDVEDLSEEELDTLQRYYTELARMAKRHAKLTESHSVEEARERHERKLRRRGGVRHRA
jgi:low affinity Fe/Cu permease